MKSTINSILVAYASIISITQNILTASFEVNPRSDTVEQNKSDYPPTPKIVGGEETVPGRYPYQVGLLRNDLVYCGGSLVASEWVLTAAHCVSRSSTIRVDIGRHDRSNKNETFEIIDVEFTVTHPNYNYRTIENDFAMIKLATPSSYPPIILNNNSTYPDNDANVTVMGWGHVKHQSSGSDILLEVEVDVLSNEICTVAYKDNFVSNNMLCASRLGKDSCQGDSGGPLIVKGENATMDKQVGIVSWGTGCASPIYPGVYARVSSGYDFIQTTMACVIPDGNTFNALWEISCVDGVFSCVKCKFPEDGFDYSNCAVEYIDFIGDGYCDKGLYNTLECNYDAGDCCEDTCIDRTALCGTNSYDCKDPESSFYLNPDSPQDGFDYSNCTVPIPKAIGDGLCDKGLYNTLECNYDGGDCCEDTCTNGTSTCGTNSYDCKDPESSFYLNHDFPQDGFDYFNCTVPIPKAIGDGHCDKGLYNTLECNYDGGDCCEDTCIDGDLLVCGQCNSLCEESCYECKDPESRNSRKILLLIENTLDMLMSIQNGWSQF